MASRDLVMTCLRYSVQDLCLPVAHDVNKIQRRIKSVISRSCVRYAPLSKPNPPALLGPEISRQYKMIVFFNRSSMKEPVGERIASIELYNMLFGPIYLMFISRCPWRLGTSASACTEARPTINHLNESVCKHLSPCTSIFNITRKRPSSLSS